MPFLKDKSKLQSRSKRLEELTKKNGSRHGVFTIHNDKYVGQWSNNTKNGKGFLLSRTYRLYEGDWEQNFRHGFGVLALRLKNKIFILQYRGDWKRGKETGFGAWHYLGGGYYLGNFKNGKRHNYGQMWYADGSFYDGDWFKDQRHGMGLWVRSDGNRYEGAWTCDLKHGKGRFFHLDSGQMQDGVWQHDFCVCSYIMDIRFRQTAINPTSFPIPVSELIDADGICNEQELKALSGRIKTCLYPSHDSINNEVNDDTNIQ